MATKIKNKFFRDMVTFVGENGWTPAAENPACQKCGLSGCGAKTPFMNFGGSEDPLITFVLDGTSAKEDENGFRASDGAAGYVKRVLERVKTKKFDLSRVRWAATTRCAFRGEGKIPNLKTRGKWCRYFLIDDLKKHPPKLIVPVGTTALGLLSFKSNAQEWSGKVLTYRGWPDDLMAEFVDSHPVLGNRPGPESHIPMYPIQSPRLVHATQNEDVISEWRKQINIATQIALDPPEPKNFIKPWYVLTTDPDEVEAHMREVKKLGGVLTYDTETTGLRMFNGDKIVFMMFRWDSPSGKRSIGFPWDYAESAFGPEIRKRLTPFILEAMYASKLQGHNLSFDVKFAFATLEDADYLKLTAAMWRDTMLMRYVLRQNGGSLGLELMPYEWCEDLAGYEEELTLLIEQRDDMNPKKGGHYAKCPTELWDTAFKPYVMGDTEVCHISAEGLSGALKETEGFKIPIASATSRGKFRLYKTPTRQWSYTKVIRPATRLLTRMMCRGMYVDIDELGVQEDLFPKQIVEAREKIKNSSEQIYRWIDQQSATVEGWEFDLENKKQLKFILFNLLGLPFKKLTKTGRQKYGEDALTSGEYSRDELYEYAATDKFTLNALAAEHPELRPLQDYRKLYKQYTSFIRPLRNVFSAGIDKKQRTGDVHLCPDMCVHTDFLLAGTKSGRLSSRGPNLQQLPKEGSVKRLYSTRFKDAGILYQADLSQIELRLMAACCGDASLVKAYRTGIDLHSLTQSLVFKRPYDHCTKEYLEGVTNGGHAELAKKLEIERRQAKIVNFLTGYGGGAMGLMSVLAGQGVYLTLDECETRIDAFFDAYPALRDMIAYYKRFILDNGCAVSLFGRVRILSDAYSEDRQIQSKALRAGVNHLIQSSASDMMLICLSAAEKLMRASNLESMLVSTVHDSLLVDCRRDEIEKVHEICMEVLNHIPEVINIMDPNYDTSWCIVPFGGDAELGKNYSDMFKIGKNPDWDKLFALVDAD